MRLITPLVLALVVTVVAGCGSSDPTGTTGTRGATNGADAAYRYARCMRSHGLTGFPDPHVSVSPGHTSISMMVPATLGSSPHFKTAEKACAGILPGPGARSDSHGPGAADLLAFARCLRGHGLSGFPDPDRNGQISPEMIAKAGIKLRGPAFLAAADACTGVTHGAITRADVLAAINGPH